MCGRRAVHRFNVAVVVHSATMRTKLASIGVACSLLALACDSSQNVPANLAAPSTTTNTATSAPPTNAPQSYPQVTMTLTGGNGPTDCRFTLPIGQVETSALGFSPALTTLPTGQLPQPAPSGPTAILVILDPHNWPTDHLADYTGTLNGSTITAVGHYYGGSAYCGGNTYVGNVNYGVPTTFTGTVSADGTRLTGHEVRTLMLGSTVYTYEYDWRAALK